MTRQQRYEASEKGRARKRRWNSEWIASGRNSDYKAERRERAKADGVCVSCTKRAARIDRTTCETCSMRKAETQALTRYYGVPASLVRECGLSTNVARHREAVSA